MSRVIAGVLVGAVLGAIMGHFGKCSTGTCPLTANPFRGALWGGFLGLLFTISFPHRSAAPVPDSDNVHIIQSEDDFRARVLESDQLCLVDFYADWCAPCRMLSPTISAVADQYVGKISVCKVNVENVAPVASRYKVRAIPKVILFENGQPIKQAEGARSEGFYREMIDAKLNDKVETEDTQ